MKPRNFNFPGGMDDWTGHWRPYVCADSGRMEDCADSGAVPVFTGSVRDLPEVFGVPSSCLTIRCFGGGDGRNDDMLGGVGRIDDLQHEVRRCISEFGPEGAAFADCGDIVEDCNKGRRRR